MTPVASKDIVYTSSVVSALAHTWLTNLDQWRWCVEEGRFQFWDMGRDQLIQGSITHSDNNLIVNIEIPCLNT